MWVVRWLIVYSVASLEEWTLWVKDCVLHVHVGEPRETSRDHRDQPNLKEDSAGYFWSCIFVFFIAHWNMSNNINHWHKNTQQELFLTLLSCNYNTTISIKTNRSKTWTLPMMSPALTSWKIDYAETTKLGGWLVFSLGLLMFRLVDSL